INTGSLVLLDSELIIVLEFEFGCSTFLPQLIEKMSIALNNKLNSPESDTRRGNNARLCFLFGCKMTLNGTKRSSQKQATFATNGVVVYLANLATFRVSFRVHQSRIHISHFEKVSLQRSVKIHVFNGR